MARREILVAIIDNRWRVITYPNEVQWVLQDNGKNIAYCRSRAGLEANLRERAFPEAHRSLSNAATADGFEYAMRGLGSALDAIAALPDWFPESQYATKETNNA